MSKYPSLPPGHTDRQVSKFLYVLMVARKGPIDMAMDLMGEREAARRGLRIIGKWDESVDDGRLTCRTFFLRAP